MIGKKRMDRIFAYLEDLEKQTGRPLRDEPRWNNTFCPISNFAPDEDGEGRRFWKTYPYGDAEYEGTRDKRYKIYTKSDSDWFNNLSEESCEQINKAVAEWIKGRKK